MQRRARCQALSSLCAVRAPCLEKQGLEVVGRHRPAEEESLDLIALQFLEQLGLRVCLHALCDHFQPERVGKLDDGRHHARVLGAAFEPAHEGAIDLHGVQGHLLRYASDE